jgi:hypothetical protein
MANVRSLFLLATGRLEPHNLPSRVPLWRIPIPQRVSVRLDEPPRTPIIRTRDYRYVRDAFDGTPIYVDDSAYEDIGHVICKDTVSRQVGDGEAMTSMESTLFALCRERGAQARPIDSKFVAGPEDRRTLLRPVMLEWLVPIPLPLPAARGEAT